MSWCGIRLFLSGTGNPRGNPCVPPGHSLHIPAANSTRREIPYDRQFRSVSPTYYLWHPAAGYGYAHHPDCDSHTEADDTGRLPADWMAKSGVFTLDDRSDARTSHRGNLNTPDAIFYHHDLSRRCSWSAGADIRMVTSVTMSGHRPCREDALGLPQGRLDGFEAALKQHSQRPRATDR